MIKYTLKCQEDHRFESWFASAEAYDTLHGAGHVACPICGDTAVSKAIMAPQVRPSRNSADGTLSEPSSQAEQALQRMRKMIEEHSTDVGDDFATKAREIHNGEAPEKLIHGKANLQEAKALIDDGVPVAPLPFIPKRNTN